MKPATHRVLTALVLAGECGLNTAELERGLDLRFGAVQSHLVRLRHAGFADEHLEPADHGSGRVYTATALGRAEARQLELLPPPCSAWWQRPFLRRLRRDAPPGRDRIDTVSAFATPWPWPVMVRNHLLGGTLNRPVDRNEAARLRALDPDIDTWARTTEKHREHLVRTLVDRGAVEQVLDLTTAVPVTGVVHCARVALADIDPPVPIVYVATDHWQIVAAEAALTLGPQQHVGTVMANPCDAEQVWRLAVGSGAIHPGRPVLLDALMITDLVPDPRRLRRVLRAWAKAVPAGSLLLLSDPLDRALPPPFSVAARAGWRRAPLGTLPGPTTVQEPDQRTSCRVLVAGRRRWWRT